MGANIRLFIADVDGTLVTPDKVLTARTVEAVNRLRIAGIAFTITSGRPPLGLKMLIDELALTEPLAAFNGGVFVHPDLSVMSQSFLAADTQSRSSKRSRAMNLTAGFTPTVTGWCATPIVHMSPVNNGQ